MNLAIVSCNTLLNGVPPGALPARAARQPSPFESPAQDWDRASGDADGPFMVEYAA
jgi:hypothetical protein